MRTLLRRCTEFAAIDDLAGYDCGYWGAAEGAAVEGGVARFAGGFGCVVRPGEIGRKNGDVRSAAHGDFSFDAQDARGAGGEKFDEAHEFDASGVDELIEAESERSFKSGDAEWSFIEFDGFAGGLVRRVIGGDSVNGAIGKTGEERIAIFTRCERWIHFEICVVGDVFINQSEMVGRDFAGDGQSAFFRFAHKIE